MRNFQHRIRGLTLTFLFVAGFVLTVSSAIPAQAAEISVTPMLIELEQKPNSKNSFSFYVRSTEKTNVRLRLFDMSQQVTGYMGFKELPAGKAARPMSRITLDEETLRLPAGRAIQVTGKVHLARKVRGTQLFAVMVEEERPQEKRKGISISVRYAVVVKVNVKGRRHREIGKFDELSLVREKDGTLLLTGILSNNSPQDYNVKSFAQIRGLDNRLVETIELRSKAAWQKKEKHSRIFPGARVRLMGPVRKITKAGIYRVRVLNRLGKRGQAVTRQELRFEPDLFRGITPPGSSVGTLVQVTPSPIPATVRRNHSTFSVFTLANAGSEAVTVKLPVQGADAGAGAAQTYSFIPQELQILPGRKKRVVLKQQFSGQPDLGERIFKAEVAPPGGAAQTLAIRVVLKRREGKGGS